jgi:Tfp pilus assembly protein PilF
MPGYRFLLVLCLLAWNTIPAPGQGAGEIVVTGRLVADAPTAFVGFRVETRASALNRGQAAVAFVSVQGEFRLAGVGEGTVELSVIDDAGTVVARRLVAARQAGEVEIRIPGATPATPARAAVSLYRLRHKPPKAAIRYWRKAAKAGKAGNGEEAERHLQEAVRADPEFADALEQLGLYALARRDYELARGFLARAADLDGANGDFQSHAAVAELMAGHPAEAEARARLAQRVAPEQGRAKYVLGLALLRQGKGTQEALRNLEAAAAEFPGAGAIAAQLRARGPHP